MPVVVGAVTAAEEAARALNKPNFIPHNVLEDYAVRPQWRVSGTLSSGTDISDSVTHPTFYGFNREATGVTRPTAAGIAGQTEVYYIGQLNPGTDGKHTLDSWLMLNHNMLSFPFMEVALQVADDAAFATNLRTLATIGTFTNLKRFGSYDFLGTAARLTEVEYFRIRFRKLSGTFAGSVTPYFGECWIGRRRQMSFKPMRPWDEDAMESDVVDFVSDSGNVFRYFKSAGRAVFSGEFQSGGADANGLNQNTELASMWRECGFGRPVIFNPNPAKMENACLVVGQPSFGFQQPGPYERIYGFEAKEVIPYVSREV